MLRFTLISLALLVCAANASLFDSLLGEDKQVLVLNDDQSQQPQNENGDGNTPNQETGLAIIADDTPLASMDDLAEEGQSGVVIRAKRYYGCGCGCCGCATVAATATVAACGCGCCGCGYGK